jgi:hypothetical protein
MIEPAKEEPVPVSVKADEEFKAFTPETTKKKKLVALHHQMTL